MEALNRPLPEDSSPADPEALHRNIATRIQSEGNCWLGITSWKGAPAMRASICNSSTTDKDIDTALKALRKATIPHRGDP